MRCNSREYKQRRPRHCKHAVAMGSQNCIPRAGFRWGTSSSKLYEVWEKRDEVAVKHFFFNSFRDPVVKNTSARIHEFLVHRHRRKNSWDWKDCIGFWSEAHRLWYSPWMLLCGQRTKCYAQLNPSLYKLSEVLYIDTYSHWRILAALRMRPSPNPIPSKELFPLPHIIIINRFICGHFHNDHLTHYAELHIWSHTSRNSSGLIINQSVRMFYYRSLAFRCILAVLRSMQHWRSVKIKFFARNILILS